MSGTPGKTGVNITLPDDLLEWVDREAHQRVVHRSLIIARALEYYLPLLPPIDLPGNNTPEQR